jgi:hypothetical protein
MRAYNSRDMPSGRRLLCLREVGIGVDVESSGRLSIERTSLEDMMNMSRDTRRVVSALAESK